MNPLPLSPTRYRLAWAQLSKAAAHLDLLVRIEQEYSNIRDAESMRSRYKGYSFNYEPYSAEDIEDVKNGMVLYYLLAVGTATDSEVDWMFSFVKRRMRIALDRTPAEYKEEIVGTRERADVNKAVSVAESTGSRPDKVDAIETLWHNIHELGGMFVLGVDVPDSSPLAEAAFLVAVAMAGSGDTFM